jgi:hypothetical protein
MQLNAATVVNFNSRELLNITQNKNQPPYHPNKAFVGWRCKAQ